MNETRKISYKSLKEKMSDEKLKLIIAGSGGVGTGPFWVVWCIDLNKYKCVPVDKEHPNCLSAYDAVTCDYGQCVGLNSCPDDDD